MVTRETLREKLGELTRAGTARRRVFAHVDAENAVQILTFVGGFVDSFGYYEFRLFLSSITGNIVLAASAIAIPALEENVGTRAAVSAVFTIAAGIGAFLAVRLRACRDVVSSPCFISVTLYTLEILMLVISLIFGLLFQLSLPIKDVDEQDRPIVTAIACLLAASMGFQAIAVKETIIDSPSTTVITSNLVTVSQNLSYALGYWLARHNICFLLPPHSRDLPERQALLVQNLKMWMLRLSVTAKPLILFTMGCVFGALLAVYVGFWALVVPIALVGFVVFEIGVQFVSERLARISECGIDDLSPRAFQNEAAQDEGYNSCASSVSIDVIVNRRITSPPVSGEDASLESVSAYDSDSSLGVEVKEEPASPFSFFSKV